MEKSDVLIFTTCYNERDNISDLIDQIVSNVPGADILVVDDNSPDGTWSVINEKCRQYSNIVGVKRPGKLGIGSAHKYALLYAMRENYRTLITMDADFSHDPKFIPSLLAAHEKNTFVTGSRYCVGGRSDYTGYRNTVSRLGNVLARHVLGVKLHELTTYFRVFDVDTLRKLPLRYVAASGYSYGVELVYHLRKAGVELREVPIHFVDRTRGASKIPRLQIIRSAFDLFILGLRRLNILRDMQPDVFVEDACPNCSDQVLAMKHFGARHEKGVPGSAQDHDAYRCTAVGEKSYPPVYTCLHCGLEQVPKSSIPAGIENLYVNVVDEEYLANKLARERTYKAAFDQISRFLPGQPGRLVEVGAYCGLFLKEAEKRGWKGVGVEPSIWASKYAREITGVDVHQGFLSDNKNKLATDYDLVVSWDVLEHVSDPHQFLVECASLLGEGGLLCVSTLDVETIAPRLLGTKWPWLIDMHIMYFGAKSIRDVFRRANLDLVWEGPYKHFARLRYFIERGTRVLPSFLHKPAAWFSHILPNSIVVPITFGDIRVYVLRKSKGEPVREPQQ
jgi:2-polyprenyl-3-methyl-5-hydroxy-6-metoxy-1,4-benzoquinol methylase